MSPPGIGAKKVHEISQINYGITYIISSSVALEGAVINPHNDTMLSKNSSSLEGGMSPAGT
jgi:hypothetical protein